MNQEARVLVVDDDQNICRMLGNYLQNVGFDVKIANNGEQVHQQIQRHRTDLVLLDLHMPGVNGLDIARDLRAQNQKVGIIIVTGSEDPVDRVLGLEIGADDFVAKPFDQRELLARMRTLLRRVNHEEQTTVEGKVRFDRFVLDLDTFELVDDDGNEIELTNYEFSLLALMVRSPNKVLSRDQIMNTIAGRECFALDRSVDVLVGKVRKKIEAEPSRPALLKTVRGAGYKFTGKVERLH